MCHNAVFVFAKDGIFCFMGLRVDELKSSRVDGFTSSRVDEMMG
jgi:hypothetical protein